MKDNSLVYLGGASSTSRPNHWQVDKLVKSSVFEAEVCRFEACPASQNYTKFLSRFQ